jgi:hypothetical protein
LQCRRQTPRLMTGIAHHLTERTPAMSSRTKASLPPSSTVVRLSVVLMLKKNHDLQMIVF